MKKVFFVVLLACGFSGLMAQTTHTLKIDGSMFHLISDTGTNYVIDKSNVYWNINDNATRKDISIYTLNGKVIWAGSVDNLIMDGAVTPTAKLEMICNAIAQGGSSPPEPLDISALAKDATVLASNAYLSNIDVKLANVANTTKQDATNTALSAIDTKLATLNAANSTNATAAKQDIQSTRLTSIDNKLTNTAKTADVTTLQASVAKEAKQDVGNNKLVDIDTKLAVVSKTADITGLQSVAAKEIKQDTSITYLKAILAQLKVNAAPTNTTPTPVFAFFTKTAPQTAVLNADLTWNAATRVSGTEISTAAGPIITVTPPTTGAYYEIEANLVLATTGSIYQIMINGVAVSNGVNTGNTMVSKTITGLMTAPFTVSFRNTATAGAVIGGPIGNRFPYILIKKL